MGIQAICFTFHSQARVAWRISNICKSRTMLDLKTPCIVTYFKAIWYKLFKILFCNKKLVVEGADCYVFHFVYLLKLYIHVYTSVMWGNTHGALVHQYHAYISWHALKDGVSCFIKKIALSQILPLQDWLNCNCRLYILNYFYWLFTDVHFSHKREIPYVTVQF